MEPYYEDVFDPRYFQLKPGWDLNVMLVRWMRNSAERVAIGHIHMDAWNEAPMISTVILLG